jgi:hypothetical protein
MIVERGGEAADVREFVRGKVTKANEKKIVLNLACATSNKPKKQKGI